VDGASRLPSAHITGLLSQPSAPGKYRFGDFVRIGFLAASRLAATLALPDVATAQFDAPEVLRFDLPSLKGYFHPLVVEWNPRTATVRDALTPVTAALWQHLAGTATQADSCCIHTVFRDGAGGILTPIWQVDLWLPR